MFLELNNIGKINQAKVELKGITIIAGENNTGKSTVGKVLFAISNSFYNINKKILEERKKSITRMITAACLNDNLKEEQIWAMDKDIKNIKSEDTIKTLRLMHSKYIDEATYLDPIIFDIFVDYIQQIKVDSLYSIRVI